MTSGLYRHQRQEGVVLLTAIIFLLLLSMLTLSMVDTTVSEEKVSRNSRDIDVAFAAAEAALRDGEMHITGAYQWPYKPLKLMDFDTDCTSGLCDSTLAPAFPSAHDLDFYSATGIGSKSRKIGSATGSASIAGLKDDPDPTKSSQPRYMIEHICTTFGSRREFCSTPAFRITAKGRGRLPNTLVVLQEIYLPADFSE